MAASSEGLSMSDKAALGVRAFVGVCRWVGVWIGLVGVSSGFLRAEIREVNLDWEPACEGSSIRVTSENGLLVLVEAWAEHFAEARDWICTFKHGVLVSVAYRHFKISRRAKGDSGEFEIERTLDRIETFEAVKGVPQKLPPALKGDFEAVLEKASESLAKPANADLVPDQKELPKSGS
ncbi:MAG: hypothetical protein KDK99_20960 [Verrucomicrobiales bacterium]|nr:hypothetical protein [Verrucomicrobiales bacterium]